jgi:predicted dehydrogenase
MALVTDGSDSRTASVLREAGADVVGLLAPEPLESLAWAAEANVPHAYGELLALLSDDVEAVCVELPPPGSDVVARHAAAAGLHVLLANSATADAEALRAAADLAEEADRVHLVALAGRAWPATWHVQASLAGLGRLTQVTILGAPPGPVGRMEVADLMVRWCGEVAAVCASPARMPAPRLTDAAPVTFALLTASGATVLVNERMDGRLDTAVITLCGEMGRIVVEGRRVLSQDAAGVRDMWTPPVPNERPGLVEATRDVIRAVELGETESVRSATFHDLLALTRLLAAADASRRDGDWVEL